MKNKNTIIESRKYFGDAYPITSKYHTEMQLQSFSFFQNEVDLRKTQVDVIFGGSEDVSPEHEAHFRVSHGLLCDFKIMQYVRALFMLDMCL